MKKFIDYISESLIKKNTKLNVEEYYILIPYNKVYFKLIEDVDYNEFQVKTFSKGITCYFLTKNQLNEVYNKYPTKSSSYVIFELPDNIDNKTDIDELKKEFKNNLSSMIEYTYGGAKKLKEIPLNKIINNKLLKEALINKNSKINTSIIKYYILVPYNSVWTKLKDDKEFGNFRNLTNYAVTYYILSKEQIKRIYDKYSLINDLYNIDIYELPEKYNISYKIKSIDDIKDKDILEEIDIKDFRNRFKRIYNKEKFNK